MFNRDYYVTVIAKIAKDARIQERADNANELLYYITNKLNAANIQTARAFATALLYGAKASRPILETLITDLEKLAMEHEQQELNLATGGEVKDEVLVKAENVPEGVLPMSSSEALLMFGRNAGISAKEARENAIALEFGRENENKIFEIVNKAFNTIKELTVSRESLHRSIETDLDNIEKKFAEKNKRYGQDKDGFYNFTQGAKLHYGDASPDNTFRMLMAYTSKHIVALEQPDALTNDEEFDERCLDVAVYMMIARAMKKATREEGARE